MAALHGNARDPLFHRPRFGRFLRQAHDANVVDVSKNDRGYEMTLKAEAAQPQEQPAERGGGGGRGRRGGRRGGGGGERSEERDQALAPAPEPPASEAAAATPTVAVPSGAPARGLRYRRGSGSPTVPTAAVPLVGVVEIAEPSGGQEKAGARKRSRGGAGRRPAGRSRAKKKPGEPPSEP
jgi:hypothetical protein